MGHTRESCIVFEFYIGGYWGVSHKIVIASEGSGYHVIHHRSCNSSSSEEELIRVYSGRHWVERPIQSEHFWKSTRYAKFLSRIEESGVSNWKKKYVQLGVMDGTGWSLFCILKNERRIEIDGSNASPKEFDAFLKIVHRYIAADIG